MNLPNRYSFMFLPNRHSFTFLPEPECEPPRKKIRENVWTEQELTFKDYLQEYWDVQEDFMMRTVDFKSSDFLDRTVYVIWRLERGRLPPEQLIDIYFEDPTPFIYGDINKLPRFIPIFFRAICTPIDFMKFSFHVGHKIPLLGIKPTFRLRNFEIMPKFELYIWRIYQDVSKIKILKGTPRTLFHGYDIFPAGKLAEDPFCELKEKEKVQIYLKVLHTKLFPFFLSLWGPANKFLILVVHSFL